MAKNRQPISPRPDIGQYRWSVTSGEMAHVFVPRYFYSDALHAKASGSLGESGYAILRSLAMIAIPQLEQSIDHVVAPMSTRAREIEAMPKGDSRLEAERAFERLGRATHWEVVTRLGIVVEQLVALIAAYEAFEAGDKAGITRGFLRHELDLLKMLGQRPRRRLSYWEAVVQMPTIEDLRGGGLETEEANLLRSGYRTAARQMLTMFDRVRTYYTPALHQIYLRFKHGYTLVDPSASLLRLAGDEQQSQRVQALMQGGFAVVHLSRSDEVIVNLVRSDTDEFNQAVGATEAAVRLCNDFATAWLSRVEHAEGKSLQVVADPDHKDAMVVALRKWVIGGLDTSVPFDAALAVSQATGEETS